MTIDGHSTKMEDIYQSLTAKAHINVKKSQQKHCNICTFNNTYGGGGVKVLWKNMADGSWKAKMKIRGTGLYAILDVTTVGGTKWRAIMGIAWKLISHQSK